MMERTLIHLLKKYHFPHQKMLFLAGPRQVGKTTLARIFLKERPSSVYYNWDDVKQKRELLKDPYAFENRLSVTQSQQRPLVVLDEIHKYSSWKNYLKGVYDKFQEDIDFIVTGSGRLNIYKKGADSLLGRYFMYNLLPLSLGEVLQPTLPALSKLFKEFPETSSKTQSIFEQLLHFSGFPEPFLKGDKSFLARWETTRKELILRQDIRELTNVREIDLVDHLMLILPEKIGSPLSLNSLTTDIDVSFKTVQNWLRILERVYYLFSITPYAGGIKRSIKKERKIYFWNWQEAKDEAQRFENFLACHLQKMVTLYNDFGLLNLSLHYCRDKNAREVDFLIVKDNKPWILLEAKLNETSPSSSLVSFMKALGLKEAFQVVSAFNIHTLKRFDHGNIRVISAATLLSSLP